MSYQVSLGLLRPLDSGVIGQTTAIKGFSLVQKREVKRHSYTDIGNLCLHILIYGYNIPEFREGLGLAVARYLY